MYILRYLRSTTFGIKGDCLKLGNHKKIGIPTENWDTNRKLGYQQKIGIPPENWDTTRKKIKTLCSI